LADTDDRLIRAAGGAIWRRSLSGELEVVLVHRPQYDDWSLPKGKVDPGESDEEAARREIQEETGVVPRLGPELPSTTYRDRFGRPKLVRYWASTVESGKVSAQHEVDEARWLRLDEARRRLTYQRDRAVLDALAKTIDDAPARSESTPGRPSSSDVGGQ
jgi:8-oxo-dGTP pyrophosphatase MutT (NUDIX family)